MKMISIEKELKENSYPGRGIIVGRSEDGKKAAIAYFIMGRSSNEENKVSLFVRYIDIATGKYESKIINKNK